MPQKYLHYFGNESSESLLEAYGIVPKDQQIDQLRPKQCPFYLTFQVETIVTDSAMNQIVDDISNSLSQHAGKEAHGMIFVKDVFDAMN